MNPIPTTPEAEEMERAAKAASETVRESSLRELPELLAELKFKQGAEWQKGRSEELVKTCENLAEMNAILKKGLHTIGATKYVEGSCDVDRPRTYANEVLAKAALVPEASAALPSTNEGLTKEFLLEQIREWKFFWMNQKQNSEADYENYNRRACGVDANMQHNLAERIIKARAAFSPAKPGQEGELREQLERVRDQRDGHAKARETLEAQLDHRVGQGIRIKELEFQLDISGDEYVKQVGTWKIIQRLEEEIADLKAQLTSRPSPEEEDFPVVPPQSTFSTVVRPSPAPDGEALKEAVRTINRVQDLLASYTTNSSMMFSDIKEAFNVNARFLSSQPNLQNEYLKEPR